MHSKRSFICVICEVMLCSMTGADILLARVTEVVAEDFVPHLRSRIERDFLRDASDTGAECTGCDELWGPEMESMGSDELWRPESGSSWQIPLECSLPQCASIHLNQDLFII